MMEQSLSLNNYLQAGFSLIFVLSIIFLGLYLVRRFGQNLGWMTLTPTTKRKRLSIEESLAIGPKQRLLIVKTDESEHLLLVTAESASLIDKNISKKD